MLPSKGWEEKEERQEEKGTFNKRVERLPRECYSTEIMLDQCGREPCCEYPPSTW